jgi:hypothetical protein
LRAPTVADGRHRSKICIVNVLWWHPVVVDQWRPAQEEGHITHLELMMMMMIIIIIIIIIK